MIRRVEQNDLNDCLRVIRESFATVAAQFSLTEQNAPTNGAFLRYERLLDDYRAGKAMFAFVENGAVVGFAQVEASPGGAFYLERLSVLPSCRHRGIGCKLVRHAARFAKENGAETLEAGIIWENTVLGAWYLSLGFEAVGTKRFSHLPFTVGFLRLPLEKEPS
jgi:ribosomal protein S18 acetylase RimI-like enzyme